MNASSIRDEWYCDESIMQNEGRNVCCVVAIRLVLKWRVDSLEYYCYLRNVEDLLADGRTPCARRIGEPTILTAQSFRVVQWLNTIRFLQETSQGSSNLVRKFYLEYSSDMC